MEAGLLAIAGAKSSAMSSDKLNDLRNKEQLAGTPFKSTMQKAVELAQKKQAASDNTNHERAPSLVMVVAAADGENGVLSGPDVLTGLSDEQLRQLMEHVVAAPVSQPGSMSDSHSLSLSVTQLTEHSTNRLLQITDSVTGSQALALQGKVQQIVFIEPEQPGASSTLEGMLHMVNDRQQALPELGGISDQQTWEPLLEQLQQLQDTLDPQALAGEAALPLVSFAMLGQHEGWQQTLRAAKLEQVQLVDVSGGKAASVSPPLADALAQNNLTGLSDHEQAELDALIDRIAQQALRKDINTGEFRQIVQDQLSDLTRQLGQQHENAQPSVLSASHSSQQARPEEGAGLRFMPTNPAMMTENSSPAEQVRVTISQALRAGMDRVVIQLEPAELGRVDVRLDLVNDGRAQIHIQTDNRETLELLQRDAKLLERALQEAGIDADMQNMAFDLKQRQEEQAETGTKDAEIYNQDAMIEELQHPELTSDPLSGSYTLSIAQGLNIRV